MDSQQRPVISKFRSDTQGTTSTTTELTISGFPRICKSTLHFVASVVRIPRACGSSSRIRLPPDAFGARPGRTLPGLAVMNLRHFLTSGRLVSSSKILEALRMDSQQRLSTFASFGRKNRVHLSDLNGTGTRPSPCGDLAQTLANQWKRHLNWRLPRRLRDVRGRKAGCRGKGPAVVRPPAPSGRPGEPVLPSGRSLTAALIIAWRRSGSPCGPCRRSSSRKCARPEEHACQDGDGEGDGDDRVRRVFGEGAAGGDQPDSSRRRCSLSAVVQAAQEERPCRARFAPDGRDGGAAGQLPQQDHEQVAEGCEAASEGAAASCRSCRRRLPVLRRQRPCRRGRRRGCQPGRGERRRDRRGSS